MAQVVPQARLIALLRNPVDRAYSDYQMVVRKGRETRTFEEAIGLVGVAGAREARSLGKEGETPEYDERTSLDHVRRKYLYKSIYVDQLQRWSRFYSDEQMLILKSEDFFDHPQEILKRVFDFLDLPQWEPEASEIIPKKRNKGRYEGGMDPATRLRLEQYFEPHNKRLYEYLGVDLGW